MVALKTLRLLQLVSYLLITAQLMYYLFLMGDALKEVHINSFVEQRQVVDRLIQQRHVPVYYACVALTLVVAALYAKQWSSPVFISVLLALVCLALDIALAKGEINRINGLVNSQAPGTPGLDWESLRERWLALIKVRGVVSTTGFVCLLAGLLWQRE